MPSRAGPDPGSSLSSVGTVSACTVAIEEVIDEHYRSQAEVLADEDPGLRETILSFRDDEIAHRELAIAHGAEEASGYELITALVKSGSRIAIWLSTRL